MKKELCIKLVFYKDHTEMHGQLNVKKCGICKCRNVITCKCRNVTTSYSIAQVLTWLIGSHMHSADNIIDEWDRY
jgi:hypothetical protein